MTALDELESENHKLKGLLRQALDHNIYLEEELRRLKSRSSKNSSHPPL